jgi:ATP-dependent Clp protease ATP-binding subunit ClpX
MANSNTGRNRNAHCSFCRKNYRDVGPLVEGPGDVYICGECIELCQSIIDQEKRRRSQAAGEASAPTPESVRGTLERVISGAPEAKQALVQATLADGPFRTVLLIGPAHSSRVLLARTLAHALRVPFAEGDGQSLVRSSFEPFEPLLYLLLYVCGFDAESARRGVIYVDGLDDRITQERLLHLWKRGGRDITAGGLHIDVSGPLFICGGEFSGLDALIARAGRHPEQPVTAEALLAFGMAPELVERLLAIERMPPLNEETLTRLVAWLDLDRMEDHAS